MSRIALAALLGLSACSPSVAPWSEGDEQPGWYDVPAEPANVFIGEVRPRLVNGAVHGELQLTEARPLYFAIKWKGVDPQIVTGVIDPSVSTSFAGTVFEAPLSARTEQPSNCATAEGRLLAYFVRSGATAPDPELDELVGVAFKPEWLFPYQQHAWNERITWSSCGPASGDLMPMPLQHDPRFRLALCDDADTRSDLVCGQPALDRTRLHELSLSVDDDGRVFLSANFVARVEASVTYVVNGVEFPSPTGQLESKLADGLWRSGRNTVEVRQGALAPWAARVVLPVHSRRPRLHEQGLREGAVFTVSWDAAAWAQSYRLVSEPLDVPPARVGYPQWFTQKPSVTETFPGFKNGNGERLQPERALLMLLVRGSVASATEGAPFHSSSGYEVGWTERLEVPVLE